MPANVGIIAAMPSEGRSLGLSGARKSTVDLGNGVLAQVCGIGLENARAAANTLVAAGVRGLVSWGIAGGLSDRAVPGTVMLSRTVVCDDAVYETSAAWRERLVNRLAPDLPVSNEAIYSGGVLVSGAADKRRLADETDTIAVDMESGAIAEVAAEAAIGLACIRVVADPVSMTLPPALGAAIDREGFVSLQRAFRGLVQRPGDLWPMLQVATHFRQATSVLGKIARLASVELRTP